MSRCTVDWCDRQAHARGLCNKHYMYIRNHGGHFPFPSQNDPQPLVCVCPHPRPERIPWFHDAWQCRRCWRKCEALAWAANAARAGAEIAGEP